MTANTQTKAANLTATQTAWLAANRVEVEGDGNGSVVLVLRFAHDADKGFKLLWEGRSRWSAAGYTVSYSDDGFTRYASTQQTGMSLKGALALALGWRGRYEAHRASK